MNTLVPSAIRDLGMSRCDHDSFWAESSGMAPRSRVRAGRPPQPDAWS